MASVSGSKGVSTRAEMLQLVCGNGNTDSSQYADYFLDLPAHQMSIRSKEQLESEVSNVSY